MNIPFWQRVLNLCGALLMLAACQTAATPASPAVDVSLAQPKLLATVFMSPTPNQSEQQATRFANRPTATLTPTDAPTPTVYVGVFLGEAVEVDGGPVIDPERFVIEGSSLNVPTPVRAVCNIPPDTRFGVGWSGNVTASAALGCPTETTQEFEGTVQIFERGTMYFRPTGDIWAIVPGGSLGGRYWYEVNAPQVADEEVIAPEGLRVPSFGFGAFWRGVEGVRDALGFARTEEQPVTVYWQRFEGGSLFFDRSLGQTFILLGIGRGGEAFGPY